MIIRRDIGVRLLACLVLALLSAACWWVWAGWDDGERIAPWQVIGCVLCLVVLGVVAARRLPAWLVVPVVPVAFTLAWSGTASATDTSGLWAVGAVLVLAGTLIGAAVVVGLTRLVQSRLRN